jgi:hypothetical protein
MPSPPSARSQPPDPRPPERATAPNHRSPDYRVCPQLPISAVIDYFPVAVLAEACIRRLRQVGHRQVRSAGIGRAATSQTLSKSRLLAEHRQRELNSLRGDPALSGG